MAGKKHSPDIIKRFLQICDEAIAEGLTKNRSTFAASVGEYQANLSKMENGSRAPTLEHLVEACLQYGYSANWLLLNVGDKKMKPSENLSLERRVSDLEAELVVIKRKLKSRK